MRLFSFRKLFCDLFLLGFFRNSKREERWDGRPRGKCMVCKAKKYRTLGRRTVSDAGHADIFVKLDSQYDNCHGSIINSVKFYVFHPKAFYVSAG